MKKTVDKLGQFLVGSPSNDFFNISIRRASINFFLLVGISVAVANLQTYLSTTLHDHPTSLALIQLALYALLGILALFFLCIVVFRVAVKWSDANKVIREMGRVRKDYKLAKHDLQHATEALSVLGRRTSSTDLGQPQVAQAFASPYQPVVLPPRASSSRTPPSITGPKPSM